MILKSIDLYNFKNYRTAGARFDSKVNLVYGKNGSGKTNLLDAIHYLCLSRSYFNSADKDLIRHGSDEMSVRGSLEDESGEDLNAIIKYTSQSKKIIHWNDLKLKSSKDILGRAPIVFVCPDDIKIVKNASRDRRDFVNRILCQTSNEYLTSLLAYRRILRQKTSALKSFNFKDELLIQALNQKMIESSKLLFRNRQELSKDLATLTNEGHGTISSGLEKVTIEYKSQYNDQSIEDCFATVLDSEMAFKKSMVGTHKDDFLFFLGRQLLRKFGSQGQIKTFLYAVKMAEYTYIEKRLNKKPILILDDIFEKLDQKRLTELLKMIGEGRFGQVFLSDTERERLDHIMTKHSLEFASYLVEDSCLKRD